MEGLTFCSEINFMPHGHCYFWQPEILWPHVLGDVLTAIAYYLIPFYLVYVIRKRKEEIPGLIFYAFALFILVCGTAHVFAAISVWHPMYRTEAVIKVLMAIVSLGTVFLVLKSHQNLLAFPTPFQLAKTNQLLEEEIRQRHKVEEQFRQSEHLLNLAMENAPIGMASVGLDGHWLKVNKALYTMLGYTEKELLLSDFQSITHPKDLNKDLTLVEKVLSGEIEKYEMEKRYLHKQGHYVWGLLSFSLLKDKEGKSVHFISQIVNISDRKQAEFKLKQSEELFRKSVNYAPVGHSLLDKKFNWVSVNNALCRIFGYTETEFLQKKIESLILPEDKGIGEAEMFQLMKREIPYAHIEKRHFHKNGSIIWIALNATIIWDNEEFLYLLIQWDDITLVKDKEAEIIKFNEQLESRVKERTYELQEANKELENFTYVLTHDLRQPLSNMANLSGIVKKEYQEVIDEDGQYMLNLIETNANRVDHLIIDMMEYTKSSKSDFKKGQVDLTALFKEEFEIAKGAYQDKLISFTIAPLPMVLGDKNALRQVCQNLLSNALKYSSKKTKIIIQIGGKVDNEDVSISVKDNGVGFDETKSHKIFEVFQRLHKSKDFEGTGIGMPITAKIIEKHGGKISAKSKINEGAIFYFTLPLFIVQEVCLQ